MKVAVVGSGGVGGLLAAVSNEPPLVVATSTSAARINSQGLRLVSALFGDRHVHPQAVTTLAEPVDFTFLTVKQTRLDDALPSLPPALAGTVIPLLNGVDHVPRLRERGYTVTPGAIRVESSQTADGTIVHGSDFVKLAVSAPLPPLFDARLDITVEPNEAALLWSKLASLAPFALMTTRYRAPLGEILEHKAEQLQQVVAECAATSVACGGPDTRDAAMEMYRRFAYGAKSSMLRDAEAGRPLELDAIGGAVLRHAAHHGVQVPAVAQLVQGISGE